MEVAIYFNNGSTAYFHEVENFSVGVNYDRTIISFDYFGISSQKKKHAEFTAENIAGYAITKGFEGN